MIEEAPNVVTEDGMRGLLAEGYLIEVVCKEGAEKRHNSWYGSWVIRAVSADGRDDKMLVTSRSYLKVRDTCPVCREDLSHQRADDGPAYLTILIVGHIMAPALHIAFVQFRPEPMLLFTIFAVGCAGLSLYLLPLSPNRWQGLGIHSNSGNSEFLAVHLHTLINCSRSSSGVR